MASLRQISITLTFLKEILIAIKTIQTVQKSQQLKLQAFNIIIIIKVNNLDVKI